MDVTMALPRHREEIFSWIYVFSAFAFAFKATSFPTLRFSSRPRPSYPSLLDGHSTVPNLFILMTTKVSVARPRKAFGYFHHARLFLMLMNVTGVFASVTQHTNTSPGTTKKRKGNFKLQFLAKDSRKMIVGPRTVFVVRFSFIVFSQHGMKLERIRNSGNCTRSCSVGDEKRIGDSSGWLFLPYLRTKRLETL